MIGGISCGSGGAGIANDSWRLTIDSVSNSPVSIYLAIVGPINAILALNIDLFEP